MYFDICGGRYLSNKHAEHGFVEATETIACKLHRQVVASVIMEKLARTRHQPSKPSSAETFPKAKPNLSKHMQLHHRPASRHPCLLIALACHAYCAGKFARYWHKADMPGCTAHVCF